MRQQLPVPRQIFSSFWFQQNPNKAWRSNHVTLSVSTSPQTQTTEAQFGWETIVGAQMWRGWEILGEGQPLGLDSADPVFSLDLSALPNMATCREDQTLRLRGKDARLLYIMSLACLGFFRSCCWLLQTKPWRSTSCWYRPGTKQSGCYDTIFFLQVEEMEKKRRATKQWNLGSPTQYWGAIAS